MKNQWKKVQLQLHYLRHVKTFGKFEVEMEIKRQFPILLIYDRLKTEEVILIF